VSIMGDTEQSSGGFGSRCSDVISRISINTKSIITETAGNSDKISSISNDTKSITAETANGRRTVQSDRSISTVTISK